MAFVQRDATGNLTGVYGVEQPGIATEVLADTDPAVIAFINRPLAAPLSLTAQLAAELGTSPVQLANALKKSAAATPPV